MRIRQITPDFWADPTIAHLSYGARLFYIGLWVVGDDAGWLAWNLEELGARLFPYESPVKRAHLVSKWSSELVASRRVRVMECGCAVIPTLERHQRHAGGTRSYTQRSKHEKTHSTYTSVDVQTSTLGTVRNGKEGNVTRERDDGLTTNEEQTSEFRRLLPISEVLGRRPA